MKRVALFFLLLGLAVAGASVLAGGNERGIDPKNFDTSASPCQDFFQYANGTWLKNNPVPAAYSSWSVDNEMRDRNEIMLKEILESAAANTQAPKGSNLQKIGDFFAAATDSAAVEKSGIAPLKDVFDRIAAIKSLADLQKEVARFHTDGVPVLFDCYPDQNLKDATTIIIYVEQGGLGLPDRDYYTRTDEESGTLRDKYIAHVSAMLQLLGDAPDKASAEANAIMGMETKLAEVSLTNVEMRDPNTYYNMVTVQDADKATPHFSWTGYFAAVGHPETQQFSYAHPKFFARMDTLLTSVPLSDWKAYLRWHVIHEYAPYLSSPFVNTNFDFYGKTLSGSK